MNAKTLPSGAPNVRFLADALAERGVTQSHVVLPITDPYVAHHAALGSACWVHVSPDQIELAAAALESLDWVEQVLTRDEAAAGSACRPTASATSSCSPAGTPCWARPSATTRLAASRRPSLARRAPRAADPAAPLRPSLRRGDRLHGRRRDQHRHPPARDRRPGVRARGRPHADRSRGPERVPARRRAVRGTGRSPSTTRTRARRSAARRSSAAGTSIARSTLAPAPSIAAAATSAPGCSTASRCGSRRAANRWPT